jgi:class 3 adenylate cyclase
MRDVLARHDDLLREEIARNDGYVFTTAGDAFSAAFSDPLAGVMAAIDAQRALAAEPWEVEEVKFGCRSTPASLMNAMATTSVRRSTARRESFQPVKVVRCS